MSEPLAQHDAWPARPPCVRLSAARPGRLTREEGWPPRRPEPGPSLDRSLGPRASVLRERTAAAPAGARVPLSDANGGGEPFLLLPRLLLFNDETPEATPAPQTQNWGAPRILPSAHQSHRPQANDSFQLFKGPSHLLCHPSCLLLFSESAFHPGLPAS